MLLCLVIACQAAFEASQQTAVNSQATRCCTFVRGIAVGREGFCPSSQAPRALWLRKCDAELSGSTLPLIGAGIPDCEEGHGNVLHLLV